MGGSRKPRHSDLRRAVSTTYYALFHTMCKNGADCLIGGTGAVRSGSAWVQAYRSVNHGHAKSSCKNQDVMKKFPKEIEDFGNQFIAAQIKRHAADYNPTTTFTRSEVLNDIDSAEVAIKDFQKTPMKDRRAFAAWVILQKPRE